MTMTAALAIIVLLQALPSPPVTERHISSVTIVGVGQRQTAPSGVLKTSVLVLGRSDEGIIRPYYLTYSGAGQVLPSIGSRCTIAHHSGRLEVVGGLEIAPLLVGEEFEDFECGPAPSVEEWIQFEWRRQTD